jgi:hypothetical protein
MDELLQKAKLYDFGGTGARLIPIITPDGSCSSAICLALEFEDLESAEKFMIAMELR